MYVPILHTHKQKRWISFSGEVFLFLTYPLMGDPISPERWNEVGWEVNGYVTMCFYLFSNIRLKINFDTTRRFTENAIKTILKIPFVLPNNSKTCTNIVVLHFESITFDKFHQIKNNSIIIFTQIWTWRGPGWAWAHAGIIKIKFWIRRQIFY